MEYSFFLSLLIEDRSIRRRNLMKKKKHFVELETYIFGSSKTIIVETEYTAEQIKADWDLRTKLINEALIKDSEPQDNEIKEWWS